MRPGYRRSSDLEEHSSCYGQGCPGCGHTGTVETDDAIAAYEDYLDRRADEDRERRLMGDDW